MTKVQKPCRICGRMFTPCFNCETDNTMFRWRRVACSFECAKEYFDKIEKTRQSKTPNQEIITYIPLSDVKTEQIVEKNMESSDIVMNDIKLNTEDVKHKRNKRKNVANNEESEQID